MDFSVQNVMGWLRKHKWIVAFVIVVATGYSLGRDRALRDNSTERQASGEMS